MVSFIAVSTFTTVSIITKLIIIIIIDNLYSVKSAKSSVIHQIMKGQSRRKVRSASKQKCPPEGSC